MDNEKLKNFGIKKKTHKKYLVQFIILIFFIGLCNGNTHIKKASAIPVNITNTSGWYQEVGFQITTNLTTEDFWIQGIYYNVNLTFQNASSWADQELSIHQIAVRIENSPWDVYTIEGLNLNISESHPIISTITVPARFTCNLTQSFRIWINVSYSIYFDNNYIGDYEYNPISTTIKSNLPGPSVNTSDIENVTISNPPDLILTEGAKNRSISWRITDPNRNLDNYLVLKNGSTIQSGNISNSIDVIEVKLDDLERGKYNFELIIFSNKGETKSDSVIAIVKQSPILIIGIIAGCLVVGIIFVFFHQYSKKKNIKPTLVPSFVI
jgi:uncharacterized protein YcfL